MSAAVHAPAFDRAAVVGAGAWGTTFATLLVRTGIPTLMWARRAEIAAEINAGTNERYLRGVTLPRGLGATTSLDEALGGADLVVVAVPSQLARAVLEPGAGMVSDGAVAVSLMKGIELGTGLRMSQMDQLNLLSISCLMKKCVQPLIALLLVVA